MTIKVNDVYACGTARLQVVEISDVITTVDLSYPVDKQLATCKNWYEEDFLLHYKPEVVAPRETTILKVGGKPFRCHCTCNVFAKIDADHYECNGCGELYTSL